MKCASLWLALLVAVIFAPRCKQPYPSASVVNLPDYKRGEALLGVKNDSAFYYFNRVVTTVKDSLQIATSLSNMAAIQSDAGDYFGSQESLMTSLSYLDEKKERDQYCLSSDYNELGYTSLNLKNYAAAAGYFQKALQLAKDDNFRAIENNNLGLAFQKSGDYAKAIQIFESALPQSKADDKKFARLLSNLARTKWLQNPRYDAAAELMTALQIRTKISDDWGLNASYAHLVDFYAKRNLDSALFFAEKRLALVKRLASPDDELEALQQFMPFAAPDQVKTLFTRYQTISDSLQNARNNAKNQFALIRFDAEKNKADNLRLQRDNSEKRLQLIWQRVFLFTGVGLFALIAVLSVRWYRRRQKQTQQETQAAIRESQLRTSQKVHDVVANGLYNLMSELEHHEVGKELLLDKIENLYEQSRDISYERPAAPDEGFSKRVEEMLSGYSFDGRKVLIVGNEPAFWEQISDAGKGEIEAVLTEMMVNMRKHSGASNVVIKFGELNGLLLIQYNDDGVGMPEEITWGNGWKSTENRIASLGGTIIFDRKKTNGLAFQIQFPRRVQHV
jgi:signal transduction histidine kinase